MLYLLDTGTLSAFRRNGRTPPEVMRWSASLDVPCHCLSVISLNEIRFGIRTVEAKDPDFAQELDHWYQAIVAEERFYRILPVNREIAELAAPYRADFETPYYDSLIAATAISLVNPWKHGA